MITVNELAQVALAAFRLIILVLTVVVGGLFIPWLKKEGIPWLKERRLYNLVCWFVAAAEKVYQYDENAGLDKYKYVINHLKDKGVEITEEVQGYIESAVNELDLFTAEAFGNILEAIEFDEDEDGNAEEEAPVEAKEEAGE